MLIRWLRKPPVVMLELGVKDEQRSLKKESVKRAALGREQQEQRWHM